MLDDGGRGVRADGRPDGRFYWVLSRGSVADGEVMVLPRGPATVMPVFSFSEEAELFRWLGGFGELWTVEALDGPRLAELLLGGYSDVDEVALDPIPEVQARPVMALVTVSRARFLESLLGRGSDAPVPDSPER